MKKLLLPLALLAMSTTAQSAVLFSEDFESGLNFSGSGNWATNISGVVVNDPIQGDNALAFTSLIGGGDLKSDTITSTTGIFNISFDYLGTCQTGNCGGFFWNSVTGWDGTTTSNGSYRDTLIDDGSWNTYSFDVSSSSLTIHLEDWNGSGGLAGDAYFDNILITDGAAPIPEPSILALLGFGLLGLKLHAKRRRSA